jgi:hypothetical protein
MFAKPYFNNTGKPEQVKRHNPWKKMMMMMMITGYVRITYK